MMNEKKKTKDRFIALRIEKELYKQLENLAKVNYTTVSEIIREGLKQALRDSLILTTNKWKGGKK